MAGEMGVGRHGRHGRYGRPPDVTHARSTQQTQQPPKTRRLTMASLRPLEDRVVLKVLDAEEKTAGGILLPDSAQGEAAARQDHRRSANGKLSKDGKRMALDVKKGDVVLFGKYAGSDVKVDGEGPEDPARERDPRQGGGLIEWPSRSCTTTSRAGRQSHGVEKLAKAVKVTLGPGRQERHHREVLRRPAGHQGRRHRRQGDRARRPLREHGRQARARGRQQDQRRRR